MSNVTVENNGFESIIRMVIPDISRTSVAEAITMIPKVVAEQYIKDHMQEIMEKVNATEVASCIVAAVAQRIAESYKPKEG